MQRRVALVHHGLHVGVGVWIGLQGGQGENVDPLGAKVVRVARGNVGIDQFQRKKLFIHGL